MTTERLVTEYTADTRNFRRGARVYDNTLRRQERLTNDRLSRIDRRWERSTRSILNTRTALVGLTGYVGAQALRELRNYAEGWRDVERRLQSIGVVSAEGQKSLVQLALRTRSAVGGTATIVQRFQRSTGAGIEITTRRVETLQKLLAVQGATGSERNALGIQLGQALQSGVLSGDEFRTIRENSPVEFLDALAKAAGVTRRELKATAEDQKLTTDLVLKALDSMAKVADDKFGALAMSGDEAFNILQTGLTVYVGNVDQALGATETINGAMAWLGEYLSDAGDGAETLAKAIKIVGTIALAVAGSRGLGALNSAFRRSAETARFAAREAKKEVAVSRQKIAAAQQQLASSRALVAQRQAEVVARLQSNRKLTGALKSLEVAKRKNARASVALAGAEVRAAAATDRLAAAQKRLSGAARASAAALRTAKSVLAFFGGPLGVAITALSTLPLLLSDVDDGLTSLKGVSDRAMQAMDRYAEASKRAGEEQERLKGRISEATNALEAQNRAELQSILRELKSEFADASSDIQSQSQQLAIAVIGNFRKTNRGFGSGALQEGETLEDRMLRLNPVLGETIQKLREIENGSGDFLGLSQQLQILLGIGEEANLVFERFTLALSSGEGIERARQELLSYAQAVGGFEEQLNAIENAEGPVRTRIAFQELSLQIHAAYKASQSLSDTGAVALASIARQAGISEIEIRAMQAQLAGSSEKAAILRAEIDAATGVAVELASTPTPDYSGAANSAAALAEQLGISLNLAQRLANALPKGIGKNIIFDPRDPRYDPEAARLGRIAAEMENVGKNAGRVSPFDPSRLSPARTTRRSSPGGGGGTSSDGGAGAERDLAAARELLVENGQKALYVEQQLNAERERLREILPSLIDLGLSREVALGVINSQLERTEERLKRVKTASEEAAESFAKGVLSDIRHAESLGDAIGRIGDRLLDLALDPVFDYLAQQFASFATAGSTGGGGFLGQIFGFLFNAKGNAFNGSGVVPFARGGVVNRPTMFNFAGNRKGVMGEAGPEAILPLSRGKNGKLGVVAELPTTPSMSAGSMQAKSTFSWTGDMVIQSNSDDPQEVGREATDQMRAMFTQMFNKQLGDAMRGGGILNSAYQKKAGA